MLFPFLRLAKELKPHGFVRKGTAMFRVHGDGVVQILKFAWEPSYGYSLYLGLLSMYGELKPEWFTSAGWNLRYDIYNVVGQRWNPVTIWERIFLKEVHLLTDEVGAQLEILRKDGIPWLNEIRTQKDLLDAIHYLETGWGGPFIQNNDLRLAPYMVCGELESAKLVVDAIIKQHNDAYERNRKIIDTEKAYAKYLEPHLEEDKKYYRVRELINSGDHESVCAYLRNNYERNKTYAEFCMK